MELNAKTPKRQGIAKKTLFLRVSWRFGVLSFILR
jgi:hypothetical protein